MRNKHGRQAWSIFKDDPCSMAKICEHIVSGESLANFARNFDFPYVTLLDWINADAERTENYARAREDRADLVFDLLDEVSDQAVAAESAVQIAGLRLKADNIKWKLARMAPKKYGEKLELAGDPKNPIAITTIERVIIDSAAK